MISSILGYENQPEVLKLFKSSSIRSTEPKSLKKEESQRGNSVFYPPGGLSPTRPRSTSVGGDTRSTEPRSLNKEEAVRRSYLSGGLSPSRPRSTSLGGGREERKASAVPKNFLDELRKNEQFRSRLVSLESLQREKDEK